MLLRCLEFLILYKLALVSDWVILNVSIYVKLNLTAYKSYVVTIILKMSHFRRLRKIPKIPIPYRMTRGHHFIEEEYN